MCPSDTSVVCPNAGYNVAWKAVESNLSSTSALVIFPVCVGEVVLLLGKRTV